MILALLSHPETERLLAPLPPTVLVCPISQAESLTQFQRRRINTVLCEWDDGIPPAAFFSQLFPHAHLASFGTHFSREDSSGSRRRGYADHFWLPFPENFFDELEQSHSLYLPQSLVVHASNILQLLEKQQDYKSVCQWVDETLQDQLSGVGWCVNVQDKDHNWQTVFASPGWTLEPSRLLASLQEFAQGKDSIPQPSAKPAPDNLLCVPLIKDGEFYGVVCGQTVDDCSYRAAPLHDVALFFGSAFHHIDMLIEKERLTFTDTLTSLYNYRYLRQFLLNEIRRCSRYNKTFSILFIDIDWFKNVNDNHGHLAGSDTLVEIGHQFASLVRESDVVVRYGGDEFVIILTETSPSDAETIAERVRKSVESHVFGLDKERNVRITISIGIAGYPDHGSSVDELIRLADTAMYDAKNSFKNTVRVAAGAG